MKNFFLLLFCITVFTACNKDDDQSSQDPISQLPEATQTGRGIFACLVNGKPFIANNAYFNCYYQYVDGGYYFSIRGKKDEFFIRQIRLSSNKAEINEGETYQLKANIENSYYAECSFEGIGVGSDTSSTMIGKLHITKFNELDYIVSGNFDFDIINPTTGDTVRIREGRFDTLFIP